MEPTIGRYSKKLDGCFAAVARIKLQTRLSNEAAKCLGGNSDNGRAVKASHLR